MQLILFKDNRKYIFFIQSVISFCLVYTFVSLILKNAAMRAVCIKCQSIYAILFTEFLQHDFYFFEIRFIVIDSFFIAIIKEPIIPYIVN